MENYTFRKLTSADIFPVCNIISKIGIRELKDCFNNQDITALALNNKTNNNAMFALGANIAFDVAGVVFANMPKCEKEIYKFLASVTDLTEKDLRNMPPADFADIIINFFKKEELQDFMKVVSKFLK